MDGLSHWPSPTAGVSAQPNGYVVVSYWRDPKCSVPPYLGDYQYEHCDTQEQAERMYDEYAEGEYPRASAIGVFAVKHGVPTGERIK